MKSLLLPWVPVYMRPCVHPPRVESPFPPVLSSFWDLLAFKAKCSRGSSSRCYTPRMGVLTWDFELSLPRESFWDIIVLQFMGAPLPQWGVWELIILPVHHSYYLCDMGHRISFFFFCKFLYSLLLWFWCSPGKRWAQGLLLHYLVFLILLCVVLSFYYRQRVPHHILTWSQPCGLMWLTECGLKVSVSQFLGLKRHHVISLAPFCF